MTYQLIMAFGAKCIVHKWRLNINESILIISLTPTGALCSNLGFSPSIRGKSCYFIKKAALPLDGDQMEKVSENCLFFDIFLLGGRNSQLATIQ